MSVSIIIPVFKEEESLPLLLSQFNSQNNHEIIIVDDSPDDLTVKAVEPFKGTLQVKIIHRRKRLGLASAVIEGFDAASGDILVCMDGDGSHPVSVIPSLINEIKNNQMVIASRYVEGGGIDPQWNLIRKLISKTCCCLASPLVTVKDPMSGCFAISSAVYAEIRGQLKPVSYKIALEIAVRGRLSEVAEVPFHFVSRSCGKSKVTLKVIAGMVSHLISLYMFKMFSRRK